MPPLHHGPCSEDVHRELSFTEARRCLVGDVNLLRRIWRFLASWQLINFMARRRERPAGEPALGGAGAKGAPVLPALPAYRLDAGACTLLLLFAGAIWVFFPQPTPLSSPNPHPPRTTPSRPPPLQACRPRAWRPCTRPPAAPRWARARARR